MRWSVLLLSSVVLVSACGGSGASIFPGGSGEGDGGLGGDATVDSSSPTQIFGGDASVGEGGGNHGCKPQTCADLNYTCGMNADGCGNAIDCGTCTAPEFCGGGGFSVCGVGMAGGDGGNTGDSGTTCLPKTCAQLGFDCGQNSDGCGNVLDCGPCAAPAFCGGGGFSLCGTGGSTGDGGNGEGGSGDGGGSLCVPKTCANLGFNCGPAGDGCGNVLNCGSSCPSTQFCGGGGPGICGGSTAPPDGGGACTPKTCKQLGFNCGPAGDGCGNVLNCGATCPLAQTCGGDGVPSVCGCSGLCEYQVACDGGATTTITGQVVAGTQAPYGTPDPVPNVLVYVPNSTPTAFTGGVSCNQCGADVSGNPLVQTTTDYLGNFTLTNVPVPPGGTVPLVIQLGRWRRYKNLSFPVTACNKTAVGQIHMPRNKTEGDIPFTAVSTGNVDALECVLLKMGVDAAEFTQPNAGGRINLFVGNGADDGPGTASETALTTSPAALAEYDEVLFPCWGVDPREVEKDGGTSPNLKTAAEQTNVIDYTNGGGRIFATHYAYAWTYNVQPFEATATWINDYQPDQGTAVIVQPSTTEVTIFAQWMNALANNGATNGQFAITAPRNDFSAINTADGTLWMNVTKAKIAKKVGGTTTEVAANPASFPLEFTFNTPVGQTNQCGRVIFSDFHVAVVNGNGGNTSGLSFPNECDTNPMTAQEKALEYLVWDLASCVPPPSTTTCTPRTCAEQGIGCGPAGDGCGNLIQCPACTAPATCGGGGVPGQCGSVDSGTGCKPITCASQSISCGPAGDGCGNLLDCGPCVAPATCGGGGVSGQCGAPDAGGCMPETCVQQNITCGPAGDGCGNLLSCGSCMAPQTCGGGGQAGKCGALDGGTCTPTTCAKLGVTCGPAGDGCGALLSCGTCVAPQTCGGGGVPGICGGGGGAQ